MNAEVARTTARHALGWLVAANAVGVLLAALLVWPDLNDALAPLTYGRWMPVHMNGQLYGWCALPIVGALGAWLIAPDDQRGLMWFRGALAVWTLALAAGGLSWLAGVTSGKLFLDWSGWARPLLPSAMLVLWVGLVAAAWRRRMEWNWAGVAARGAVLAGLFGVPVVLFWSMGREVYPSVNPDSGGATGAALLGSTLGLVAIAGWLPEALGVARKREGSSADGAGPLEGPALSGPALRDGRHGGRPSMKARGLWGREGFFWWALAASGGVFAVIDHGDASHHAWAQIVGLGTLLAWAPLLARYYRGFAWPATARPWLLAALGWWTLLLISGWVTFLPGTSERWKFTHVLVAHAHLAMAGVVTCLGVAILAALGRAPGGGARAFWAWQVAHGALLVALTALGEGEVRDATGFFGGAAWVQAWLAVRLVAGAVMLGASVAWLGVGYFMKKRGWGQWMALGAGAMDLGTGVGLVLAPVWTLARMGVPAPGTNEAEWFMRFVGAFVGAVGATYLWAAAWPEERLRVTFGATIWLRGSAALFTGAAVALGPLAPAWLAVTATDGALVVAQAWWLTRKAGRDE